MLLSEAVIGRRGMASAKSCSCTSSAVCVLIIALFVLGFPGVAAAEDGLAGQLLPAAGLPGFMLTPDRGLSPISLMNGYGPFYRFAAAQGGRGGPPRALAPLPRSGAVEDRVTGVRPPRGARAAPPPLW